VDVGFDVQRTPQTQSLLEATRIYSGPSIWDRFVRSVTDPANWFRVREQPLDIFKPHIPEVFQEASRTVARSISSSLGRTVLGRALADIDLGDPMQTGLRTYPVEPLPYQRGRPRGMIRSYWQTANSLTRGVFPRYIPHTSATILGLTEDWLDEVGYVQGRAGWVLRDEETASLSNVYGGPSHGRPETISVSYGGGGGGGYTRQQSSHLINWRI
jgi:hypothetical protein